MKYSYKLKKACIKAYKEKGIYPPIPERVLPHTFKNMVREGVRKTDIHYGILKHSNNNNLWTPEEKLELTNKVKAGETMVSVSDFAGINIGLLYSWIKKYDSLGYNGFINQKKGRKVNYLDMKKINIKKPRELKESEYEELVCLRAENEYIKAEIEVIKKWIALRQEEEAARLKSKKQRSSKNSVKKDIH